MGKFVDAVELLHFATNLKETITEMNALLDAQGQRLTGVGTQTVLLAQELSQLREMLTFIMQRLDRIESRIDGVVTPSVPQGQIRLTPSMSVGDQDADSK